MCHLVREESFESEPGREGVPAQPPRLRPRRAGVVAALLVGGFAAAALLAPSRVSPLSTFSTRAGDVHAVLASRAAAPAAGGLERTALPADDDVPSAPDTARVGAAPCHHGM
jgi:hypothetical protein